MLLDKILLCWYEKAYRLIPKRNLKWIQNNYNDLYKPDTSKWL